MLVGTWAVSAIMCDGCKAIDIEIVGFERLRATVNDKFALALMAETVVDLQSEKDDIAPRRYKKSDQ
jgi:hypothetical protein